VGAILRDYKPEDYEAVRAIHSASQIDYKFPDLSTPLFVVTKVVESGGVVRACGGCYLQAELYLWLDKTDWATPTEKLEAIKSLDAAAMHDLWLKGVDCAVLWLPPGMERFGERLVSDLGFERDRSGWFSFSKKTK
jgi:hypothetical protein